MEESYISFIPLLFIGLAAVTASRALIYDYPLPLKILARLWICMFAVEIVGHVTKPMELTNRWVYNVFHVFFYFFLANIYFHLFKNETLKASIQIFYYVFIVSFVFNTIFFQGILSLQTLTLVFGGCFILFLAGAYFWQILVVADGQPFTRDPYFWLSLGLIVYFGGTVPFLGMYNYLGTNFPEFGNFYFLYIYNAFSVFLNIIICVTFLCRTGYQKLS